MAPVRSKILLAFAGGAVLLVTIAGMEAQPPGAVPAPGAAGRGPGRVGRFKVYSPEAVTRGFAAYNSTCGYCHGERGKGGKAGPDLVFSEVTLHDQDGIQLGARVRGAQHAKAGKVEVSDSQIADIAAYLHSRVIYASGRGDVRMSEVLIGNAKAGEAYFNGAGGCNKCHSPSGDLKGVAGKYDVATLQDRLVMPRTGRGGRGAGPANATAPYATLTLPSGESIKGAPIRVTDFDVTLRLADGSMKTWARNRGIPKVEITDPLQAHIDIMMKLSDNDMHNLTAYLATFK